MGGQTKRVLACECSNTVLPLPRVGTPGRLRSCGLRVAPQPVMEWEAVQPSGLGPDLCVASASASGLPAAASCCPLRASLPILARHSLPHFALFFLQISHCSVKLFSYFICVCLLSAPGSKNQEPLPPSSPCTSALERGPTQCGAQNVCGMNE